MLNVIFVFLVFVELLGCVARLLPLVVLMMYDSCKSLYMEVGFYFCVM